MTKNVPKLRFKEFTEEWEERKLGDIASISKSSGLSKTDLSESGNPCILYGELYTTYGDVIDRVKSKTEKVVPSISKSEMGDVIIPSSGETPEDIATASCVLVSDVMYGGDLNILKVRPNDGRFLSYQLNHKRRFDIAAIAQGATVSHLYGKALANLLIKLTNVEEQSKIATFLSTIDSRIEVQSDKVGNLEEMKKGLMQKLFSQEIRFKRIDGSEYPEWEFEPLDELIEITNNKFNPANNSEQFLCVELEHISQGNGRLLGHSTTSNQKSIKNKFYKGQVLFGKLRPYLEKYWLTKFDGVCSSEIWVLKGKKIVNEFLFVLVQTNKFISEANISSGSKMPRADWSYMKDVIFEYPSIEEQGKISTFLFNIDEKIELEKDILEVLTELKKGLLQQMFV